MKNNFVATFILLAVGLIFNDVASVHGKPTKRNPNGWQRWQIEQVSLEGINAIYRCYGVSSDYKYPKECDRAERIEGNLVNFCDAGDPISCKILSTMLQAKTIAEGADAAKTAKSLAGD
jgi:hypothetical protein